MASTPFPEATTEIGKKLYDVADLNSVGALSALAQAGIRDRTSALYVAAMSAAPALRFISSLIAHGEEHESKAAKASKETALITGLILGRMVQPEGDNVRIDFTPRNVLAAIEAAGLVAGYDLKPFVDEKMLASYQEGLKDESQCSLGYWDFIPDVGQTVDFSDLDKNVIDFGHFSKTKH